MSAANEAPRVLSARGSTPLRALRYGFVYWLIFLLALQPGNVLDALRVGHALAFDHEALRILGAAVLGASVTPVLLWLTRRWPVLGSQSVRDAGTHLAAAAVLSLGLNVVSSVLAAWVFEREMLPSVAAVAHQLAGNWLLLVFALLALTAILHAVYSQELTLQRAARPSAGPMARIPVKTRGRLHFIEALEIDWVETQGNYLALHVGAAAHLIRQTSVKFEAQLDAARFVRIHRRTIVAIDRVAAIAPLANGDAVITLLDGHELRMSRRYREAVRTRWRTYSTGTTAPTAAPSSPSDTDRTRAPRRGLR